MEIQKGNSLQSLAIVILNYNGIKWLDKFLPKVIEFSKNHDIYVIDNASKDNSISFLEENFPNVNIIINKSNKGYAAGYNEGLKSIKTDIYCLLNSDVEVTENWIQPILDLFKTDSEISAIQPKILNYNNQEYFEFAGAGGGYLDNLGYPYCRGRLFYSLEKDSGQYDYQKEIFWASGACFFIRRKDFWNEKGFDKDFFAHMEEIDLCWRLKNKNKKIFYCGRSKIYHVGGGTLDFYSPRKTYLNFRNNLLMLYKNLPKKKLFPIILSRLFLDGIAGINFMFTKGFRHCWSIIMAHFSFYNLILKERMKRKPGIDNYYEHKNIVYQFFIKKRKQYKDLK